MAEFWLNFHFLRPWYLLALPLIIWFYARFFKGVKNKSSWEKAIDKNLLEFLLVKGSSSSRKALAHLALIASLMAIIAAAGPTWKKREIPNLSLDNPVMILLNLSSDMAVEDVTPSRLERAKFKIADLFAAVPSAQVGLIVYTEEPFLITPITHDLKLVDNLLPKIDLNIMPINGDRLDRAIGMAVKKLDEAGYAYGNIVILAADAGEKFDLSIKAAADSKYAISAINISKTDGEKLKIITQKGQGTFANLSAGDEDIKAIGRRINQNVNNELRETESMRQTFEDFGYYLVFIPLLCCLYFFRKGILVVMLICFAGQAQAGFFLNNNQDGLKAFNQGEFDKAAKTFDDEKWKAAALYREGEYGAALSELSKFDDITSLYNQGNALAKSGKIEEAIKKYEEVLGREPEHEDAKFNLEYLKKQQQQQNQQQNQQQDNQEQKDSQDQQQGGGEQSSGDEKQDNQDKKDESKNGDNQPSSEDEKKNETAGDQEKQNQEQMMQAAKGDNDEEYDEEVQAREVQFREVPEDAGGLLRAFIAKEYKKDRYGEGR